MECTVYREMWLRIVLNGAHFISSAVFGENPRYCHSLLVVCHLPFSCAVRRPGKTFNIGCKMKMLSPTAFKLHMWMYLDEFYQPHPLSGHKVKVTVTSTCSRALAPIGGALVCILLYLSDRSRWLSGRASVLGAGGRGFDPQPQHTRVVKNDTCSSIAWRPAL